MITPAAFVQLPLSVSVDAIASIRCLFVQLQATSRMPPPEARIVPSLVKEFRLGSRLSICPAPSAAIVPWLMSELLLF